MSVVEAHTFRLVADADEAGFLAADTRVQTEVYYRQPGLVRRTMARSADGEWLALMIWRTEADAEAGSWRAGDHPLTSAFRAQIDTSSMGTRCYATLE
jgi:hypothetical protein